MRYAKITLRAPSPLNAKLNQRLSAYVTAASAAGVAMLAAAPFAEAKIVYTPANLRMTLGGNLPIDINGDGVDDSSLNGDFWARRLSHTVPTLESCVRPLTIRWS
jgi:hypothetical protein